MIRTGSRALVFLALAGCSIDPHVDVDQVTLNVTACIEEVAGGIDLVKCEAGSALHAQGTQDDGGADAADDAGDE